MMSVSPCKGCTDRWVTDTDRCHTNCERYLEYRRKADEEKSKMLDGAVINHMQDRYEKDRTLRVRRGRFR